SFAPDAADDHETVIAVVNPRPVRRTEVVERLVVLQPEGPEWDELGLYDEAGNAVPFEVSEVHYVERFWGIDYREALTFPRQRERFDTYLATFPERMHRSVERKDESDCFFNLRFVAEDLPPLGHANFFLEPRRDAAAGPTSDGGVVVAGDTIGNEHLSVTLHPDGTFDVLDKRTGETFAGLSRLADTEDIGDEYDFCAAPDSETVTSRGAEGEVVTVAAGGLVGTLETTFALWLPESIHPDRRRRGERRVPCPVRVRVTLRRDARAVDVSVAFENRADDHRLTARFPTGIASGVLVSDGPFVVHDRPIERPAGEDWVQPPPDTFPQQEFSLVSGKGRGLAVLSRGLPEVAAERDEAGGTTIGLTLLRAVGWLSRDDFESRRCMNAGPTIPTPGAQCRGVHRFHYAVVPYDGDRVAAGLARISDLWRHPVIGKQGVKAGLVPGGEGLFETADERTVVTAVKRHRERDTLVVRLVNPGPDPVQETLTFGRPVAAAWRTDLLESREADLPVADRTIGLTLAPHEIATLEIEIC
ncbi:MAG: glycoside hydrolase family 38 C-terminal domain-containing protein, partial [Planctomycetota bacterium]